MKFVLILIMLEAIDYRCDDALKSGVGGDTYLDSWYLCVGNDSRIKRMPVTAPLKALVHSKTAKKKKKTVQMECQF